MKLTLEDIPKETDPDCRKARNADHDWTSTIESLEELAEVQTALHRYQNRLHRYPGEAAVLQPKINELKRLIANSDVRFK